MNDNERSEHFKGFARLLWEEMLSQTQGYYIDVTAGHIPLHHPEDDDHKPYIDLIAQRAYDLVFHSCSFINIELNFTDETMTEIPDMTEWPENQSYDPYP